MRKYKGTGLTLVQGVGEGTSARTHAPESVELASQRAREMPQAEQKHLQRPSGKRGPGN